MLVETDPDELRGWDILEIGCGSGRLAAFLGPQVKSYTGFDIAPGMVDAARDRCKDIDNARFFVGDGLRVPPAAADRQYDFVLTVAVLIHLPKSVIHSNIESAWQLLTPGGQLRFQVLADASDPTGIVAPEQNAAVEENVGAVLAQLTEEEVALSSEEGYMGHPFRYAETREFFRGVTKGARVELYRGHLGAIYGLCEKPA